jgi:hypothetical protein
MLDHQGVLPPLLRKMVLSSIAAKLLPCMLLIAMAVSFGLSNGNASIAARILTGSGTYRSR